MRNPHKQPWEHGSFDRRAENNNGVLVFEGGQEMGLVNCPGNN